MRAAKTLSMLVKAAVLHKQGKLLAAAEELQQASEEDLDMVQELVSTIDEVETEEEQEVASRRQRAARIRARSRIRASEEELDLDDDVAEMASVMASKVKASDEADELEEASDEDLEEFDAVAAKTTATRRALAMVRRAKASVK